MPSSIPSNLLSYVFRAARSSLACTLESVLLALERTSDLTGSTAVASSVHQQILPKCLSRFEGIEEDVEF